MKVSQWLLVLLLGLTSSGCAMFRSGNARLDGELPLAQTPKPSLAMVVTVRYFDYDGVSSDTPATMARPWIEGFERSFARSGLFSRVDLGLSDADLKAQITVDIAMEGNKWMPLYTGGSLLIIPGSAKENYSARATFRDRDGNAVSKADRGGYTKGWMGLIFLPFVLSPGHWFTVALPSERQDVIDAVLLEATDNGLFRSGP